MKLQFAMPTRLIVEKGAVAAHAEIFTDMGRRCLLVTDHTAGRLSGALGDVTRVLDAADIPWSEFDRIGPNPTAAVCVQGSEAGRAFGADFVVGIGGGSPMDAAKAIAVLMANPDLTADTLRGARKNPPLPCVLVGTTAGTGSEVTRFAVLTHPDGEKSSISGVDIMARAAFGDPVRYTMGLKREVTFATALDAAAHAVESYFMATADEISKGFSIMAMRLLIKNFRELCGGAWPPSARQREELYAASIYSGFAINTAGTGFCHQIGHALTEVQGAVHGNACAALLGEFLRMAEERAPEETATFCAGIGIAGTTEIWELIHAMLPGGMRPFTAEELAQLLPRWEKAPAAARHPGGMCAADYRAAAESALGAAE